ncbi:MAG: hypothetical protein JWQ30_1033 [Sediminibacterium sp.]|nr:hypothetical protein [Sediminibacterium sp.]
MTWAKAKEIFEVLAFLWAIFSAIYIFSRKMYRTRIKDFLNLPEWFKNLENKTNANHDIIKDIMKEMRPNGGNSLRDQVTKLDVAIQSVDRKVDMNNNVINTAFYLQSTPMFKADADGEITFVNKAWLLLAGFTDPKEAFGNGWKKAIHPDDVVRFMADWKDAIESESQFSISCRYKNRITQLDTPVSCRTALIRNEKKEVILIIGFLDILSSNQK